MHFFQIINMNLSFTQSIILFVSMYYHFSLLLLLLIRLDTRTSIKLIRALFPESYPRISAAGYPLYAQLTPSHDLSYYVQRPVEANN